LVIYYTFGKKKKYLKLFSEDTKIGSNPKVELLIIAHELKNYISNEVIKIE
jgi:hypothetical protein